MVSSTSGVGSSGSGSSSGGGSSSSSSSSSSSNLEDFSCRMLLTQSHPSGAPD